MMIFEKSLGLSARLGVTPDSRRQISGRRLALDVGILFDFWVYYTKIRPGRFVDWRPNGIIVTDMYYQVWLTLSHLASGFTDLSRERIWDARTQTLANDRAPL